ncbi:MAG: amidohydrolase family protein [Microbacteriaceae bacterium]|nr:amidohydrolase family protein [Microbacteriaceae bacterium]
MNAPGGASGYVDLHGHGGGGGSVEDGPDGIRRMLAAHAAHGTARQVLSLVANPVPRLVRSLAVIRGLAAEEPQIAGAHLEGPFLAPERHGAHDPRHLVDPSPALVDELLAAGEGVLRMITIAPELPGALDAIARFAAAGVVVAVGHTDAGASLAQDAFDAGARVLTHAFNAMRPIAGREPGPLGAALTDERVTIEVIADGIHVHPDNLRWLFAAAPDRIAAVTDAMAAAGAGDGDYRLGALDVAVRDGRAVIAGTDRLAGSTLTLDRAVRVLEAAGVPAAYALAAVTTTPARVLGLAHTEGDHPIG